MRVGSIWEIFVSFVQYSWEPKTALKNNVCKEIPCRKRNFFVLKSEVKPLGNLLDEACQ